MDFKINKKIIGLVGLLSVGCSEDWNCRDLDPLPYGEFSAQIKVCDTGSETFEQDNADSVYLKLVDKKERVVASGEMGPTNEDYVFTVRSFDVDTDFDGENDFVVQRGSELRYDLGGLCFRKYDDDGNETSVMCDTDFDAQINFRVDKKYQDSLLVREKIDNDGDGKFDKIIEQEFFANGRVKKIIYDDDADGEVDATCEFEYYADGTVKKEIFRSPYKVYQKSFDEGGSLEEEYLFVDSFWQASFYQNGNLVEKIQYQKGESASVRYEYDDQDRLLVERMDYYSDGKVDWEKVHAYEGEKRVITTQKDYQEGELHRVTQFFVGEKPIDPRCPDELEFKNSLIDWRNEKSTIQPYEQAADGKFDYQSFWICNNYGNSQKLIDMDEDIQEKWESIKDYW
jgi:hypothetical protein